jgi:Ca2+-binding EF-hand superfamily protein
MSMDKVTIGIEKKNGGEWDLEKLDKVLKTIDFFKDKKIKNKDLPDICKRLRY